MANMSKWQIKRVRERRHTKRRHKGKPGRNYLRSEAGRRLIESKKDKEAA